MNENNNAFTQILLTRSNNLKIHRLPIGLRSLKSNPYLLYLLNYNEQQNPKGYPNPLCAWIVRVRD